MKENLEDMVLPQPWRNPKAHGPTLPQRERKTSIPSTRKKPCAFGAKPTVANSQSLLSCFELLWLASPHFLAQHVFGEPSLHLGLIDEPSTAQQQ